MAVPDVVVVDHHDSYTWNLVHLVAAVTGVLPTVVQHDGVSAEDVLRHSHVVLSPGPGHPAEPADFAVGGAVLLAATRPVLGVCLGMQGLVAAYGGTVDRVPPGHGVLARVDHDGTGLFAGLPDGFAAVRYHSLAAVTLPDVLRPTATDAESGLVMGVVHRDLPLAGVQFHPESILSEHGEALMRNFPLVSDPVSFFRSVAAAHPRCFWLDGGGARDWSGRRSIIGWLEPDDVSLSYDAVRRQVTRHAAGGSEVVGDDPFAVLAGELAEGESSDQWFGYLGYACRADLPAHPGGPVPDAVWMRPSTVRLFDHPTTGTSYVPGAIATGPDDVSSDYTAAFERVQEHLHAGNSYEVNLTYRDTIAADIDPADAYLRLRALNPAPYAGFLQHDVPGARGWLLSSSPERYALVTADRGLETKPIKGTTPRGATPEEDDAHRRSLASDPRFRAENLMIVDLLRNDVSMVCEPGSVEVPSLMVVESYETVHQLVSTVRGRLRDGISTLEALRTLFPAGSMTGAPKLRTMQVIAEVEPTPRSAYAGAFGWIAADGRADLGVVIRSLFTGGDGHWTLGTGGGITVQSTAVEEYAESAWKAARLRAVFED